MDIIPKILPVAESDIGTTIFWIVVGVITLISKAVELSKKNKKAENGGPEQSHRPAERPTGVTSAQAELEEFLQSLNTDVPQPKPQQKPQPVKQAPPPPPPPPRRTQIQQKPEQPVIKPAPQAVHKQILSTYSAEALENDFTEQPIVCEGAHKISELALALRDDLQDRDAIKKAIVLKEVLGPPLALRTGF